MFSKDRRFPHMLRMTNGPLGHLTAPYCLVLQGMEADNLRRGRRRLFVGGKVSSVNRVLGNVWPHWVCVHDLISARLANTIF